MLIELNTSNFKENIKSWITLVDFWSDDCSPCKAMLSVLEDFAKTNTKNIKICKLNWNANMSVVQEYRIMTVPTLIIFDNGKPVEQLIWLQNKEKLEEVTKKYN